MGDEGGEFKGVDDSIAVEVGAEIRGVKFENFIGDIKRVDVIINDLTGITGQEQRIVKIESETIIAAKLLAGKTTLEVGQTLDVNIVIFVGDESGIDGADDGPTKLIGGNGGGVNGGLSIKGTDFEFYFQ